MNDTIKKNLEKITRFLKTPASELFNKKYFNWNFDRAHAQYSFNQNSSLFQWNIEPSAVANFLRSVFIVGTASLLLWLILSCLQYPGFRVDKQGTTYYEMSLKNDPSHLFSKRMMQLDGIKIQGIMITKDLPSNPQGYVIFDMNGKNVGPIEVGETFGKGLFLQAITNDSATITYQGQQSTINLYPAENPAIPKK